MNSLQPWSVFNETRLRAKLKHIFVLLFKILGVVVVVISNVLKPHNSISSHIVDCCLILRLLFIIQLWAIQKTTTF